MAGSSFGKIFTVTTWGESHGPAVGAVIDGVPAGVELCEADIQKMLDRRRPGGASPGGAYNTTRNEADSAEILSGVFEGQTTGAPVSIMIRNLDRRAADYSALKDVYRPGHADLTCDEKYGFRDYRGGGRASGRETAARVAAGAVAEKVLESLGISFTTRAAEIGGVPADDTEAVAKLLDGIKAAGDSVGGIVECVIKGVPAGLGDPVFDKADARLAAAVMSIGAVKGVEIGDGFAAASAYGSANNDGYAVSGDGTVQKLSNHSGGILGGITDGSDIVIRAAFKPVPSIACEQHTVNKDHENITIQIGGRHDRTVVFRGMVVMEAMAAITVLDMLLANMSARMSNVKLFYEALAQDNQKVFPG